MSTPTTPAKARAAQFEAFIVEHTVKLIVIGIIGITATLFFQSLLMWRQAEQIQELQIHVEYLEIGRTFNPRPPSVQPCNPPGSCGSS